MRDLYAASMGQYIPGGGATTGVNPQAATLQTQQEQIAGQGYNQAWNGGGYAGGYTTQPGQPQTAQTGYTTQAMQYPYTTQQQGYQQQMLGAQGDMRAATAGLPNGGNNPGGADRMQTGQVWGSGLGVGQQGATPDQSVQATGNGTNMYGGQQQQYNLPAPNQISAQAWGNFTPSQQQMMLGMYEANGWDKNDVQALYNQSLPKYATNSPTAGTWRLQ